MFLLDITNCGGSGFLKVLLFIKEIMDIIFIIVPIGLIIMMLIDLSKAVMAGDAEEMKKVSKIVVKRIVYAVVLFAVPTIVSIFNSLLGELSTNSYATCLTMASDKETLARLEEDEKASKLAKMNARAAAALIKQAEELENKARAEAANIIVEKGTGYDGVIYYENGIFYTPSNLLVPVNGTEATKGSADQGYNKYFFAMLANFTKAAKEAGYTIDYGTGVKAWRSYDEQKYFWDCSQCKCCNNGNTAAYPGSSNHGWGIASDLVYHGSQKAVEWAHAHAEEYGLEFSVPDENWHIVPLARQQNDEKAKQCVEEN